MAELVEEHADNGSRHTSERYNVCNSVEAMLGIFYSPPHAQNGFSFYRRAQIGAAAVQDFLCRQLTGEMLNGSVKLLS